MIVNFLSQGHLIIQSKYLTFRQSSCTIISKMYMKVLLFRLSYLNLSLEAITNAVITSDNKYMVSASLDKSIKIFDFQTKKQIKHYENVHEGIFLLSFISGSVFY